MNRLARRLASTTAAARPVILMTRPTHYTVNYSINAWMDTAVQADKAKADRQWETLKWTLEECGADVRVMESAPALHYPDIVFVANAAVVRGNKAYLANFAFPERQGETHFYRQHLEKEGFETVHNPDISFEGAGDALWGGAGWETLFCGVGPRSDVRALADVQRELAGREDPIRTVGCRLVDPRFYHIDTAFCPLEERLGIWYPRAFCPISQHHMQNEMELVAVPEADACRFACNAVVVGKYVVTNKGNEATGRLLRSLGYEMVPVDMSEFIKAGGSAKCCTLRLDDYTNY